MAGDGAAMTRTAPTPGKSRRVESTLTQTVWKALLWLGIVLGVFSALVRVALGAFFGSDPLACGPSGP